MWGGWSFLFTTIIPKIWVNLTFRWYAQFYYRIHSACKGSSLSLCKIGPSTSQTWTLCLLGDLLLFNSYVSRFNRLWLQQPFLSTWASWFIVNATKECKKWQRETEKHSAVFFYNHLTQGFMGEGRKGGGEDANRATQASESIECHTIFRNVGAVAHLVKIMIQP